DLLQRHWRALENSCNQLARVILLPKRALLREIGDGLFRSAHLCQVAKRFQVSPSVFVYRFHVDDISGRFDAEGSGLLACVRARRDGAKVIAAHAVGSLGRTRWPKELWASG